MKKLIGLQAKAARIIKDGKEADMSVEEVQVGDEVIEATINKIGSFKFEATKVGKDTVLA